MSSFSYHTRTDSSDDSSYGSTGSAYQLILDHILAYPASYEIPLRTMYTLNCTPRVQSPHTRSATPSSTNSSPNIPQGSWQDGSGVQTLQENLVAQISRLPNQQQSLPPRFLTSFVRRCFPADLVCVDFPQALTGLDYLKDLETGRRKEVARAMGRLAIDRTTLDLNDAALAERDPGVLPWVQSIEEKERKVEALYTQLYIALRRWILVNELSLLPFNKHNCVAMLNTLYPPVLGSQPTSKLTPSVLKNLRDGFFKYILSVEKHGPRMLTNLMNQGKAHGEPNGWPAVTRTLDMYLQLANSIIRECADVEDVQDISPQLPRDSRSSRKADSGVSFNETPHLAPQPSSNPANEAGPEPMRPKTPLGSRAGTALERIARGLKTIGRSRTDVVETIRDDSASTMTTGRSRVLRKMRSFGVLERGRSRSALGWRAEDVPAFDVEQMRRQRMEYEANHGSTQT